MGNGSIFTDRKKCGKVEVEINWNIVILYGKDFNCQKAVIRARKAKRIKMRMLDS